MSLKSHQHQLIIKLSSSIKEAVIRMPAYTGTVENFLQTILMNYVADPAISFWVNTFLTIYSPILYAPATAYSDTISALKGELKTSKEQNNIEKEQELNERISSIHSITQITTLALTASMFAALYFIKSLPVLNKSEDPKSEARDFLIHYSPTLALLGVRTVLEQTMLVYEKKKSAIGLPWTALFLGSGSALALSKYLRLGLKGVAYGFNIGALIYVVAFISAQLIIPEFKALKLFRKLSFSNLVRQDAKKMFRKMPGLSVVYLLEAGGPFVNNIFTGNYGAAAATVQGAIGNYSSVMYMPAMAGAQHCRQEINRLIGQGEFNEVKSIQTTKVGANLLIQVVPFILSIIFPFVLIKLLTAFSDITSDMKKIIPLMVLFTSLTTFLETQSYIMLNGLQATGYNLIPTAICISMTLFNLGATYLLNEYGPLGVYSSPSANILTTVLKLAILSFCTYFLLKEDTIQNRHLQHKTSDVINDIESSIQSDVNEKSLLINNVNHIDTYNTLSSNENIKDEPEKSANTIASPEKKSSSSLLTFNNLLSRRGSILTTNTGVRLAMD